EPESTAGSADEESINFNVGGWHFSIPRKKVAEFPDSLLWKEASTQDWSENLRLFIDQDGFVFRHLHYYMQTSKLSFFSCAELNLLYEQALILQLTPLIQILSNFKEEKCNSQVQPADISGPERTPLNYWRTRRCANKPRETPPKIPEFTGLREGAPLGLVNTPLLDTEEEVNYCFLPLDLVRKYPVLVNDDNLLWLLENAVLIECEYSEFRFIVNFLRSEKILLPDDFSNIDALEEEALILGIPELIEAVRIYRGKTQSEHATGGGRGSGGVPWGWWGWLLGGSFRVPAWCSAGFICALRAVCRVRFAFAGRFDRNWLGTCRLPLTENMSEIQELCAYLDEGHIMYEPMKDALRSYLKQQMSPGSGDYSADWTAEVSACSLYQIVKVYVGSSWYETYLQTLLKYPELLSNSKKVSWITYGQSLLIHGDGQMFRHVLNFLRLGKLFLPAGFREWALFRQEAEEYQIPSLLEALCHCDAYLWVQNHEVGGGDSSPCRRFNVVPWNNEHELSKEAHLCAAVDASKHCNTWHDTEDLRGKQNADEEKAKPAKTVPQARGTKQKDTGGGHDASSHSVGASSLRLLSPPRKRGRRSSLAKKAEDKDSATRILKLISLVKGWDVLSSRRCGFQQVKISDGCVTESVAQGSAPEEDRGARAPLAKLLSPGEQATQESSPTTQRELGAEGKQLEQDVFKQSLPVTLGAGTSHQFCATAGKTAESTPGEQAEGFATELQLHSLTEMSDSQQTKALLEHHGNVGLILKVEHPPVLGSDGFHMRNEESVVYSARLDGAQMDLPQAQVVPGDIVFLRFALSHEEIFYARKCHIFLTDVILDSIRQKDPREITAQVATLVNRLWTRQITPKEFVGGLLSTQRFKGDRSVHEKLLKWVEFTLVPAWKYSRCLAALVQRGFARSVSCFAL
ncbi:KCD19 protein, partial [Alectura lathami]|nr:KCD19 protein [Alectura lathami]